MATSQQIENIRLRLSKKYEPDVTGTWVVNAISPVEIEPRQLGYFSGRYADIIEHALKMKAFVEYNDGGTITKLNIITLEPIKPVDTIKETWLLDRIKKTEEEILSAQADASSATDLITTLSGSLATYTARLKAIESKKEPTKL